jgi:hypothetical protein
MGRHSSGPELHEAAWLDMNMIQSGHGRRDQASWDMVAADYNRTPVKPVLDGEPCYEHHPIKPYQRKWKPEFGRFSEYDVRKQAYRAVFAGACGHTYGSHSIWQFWARDREPVNFAMPTWDEALLGPGARQMIHVKKLMLSRPYLCRIPAQDMLPDVPPTPTIPEGEDDPAHPVRAAHAQATRCASGSYAMIYFPQAGQTLRLDLRPLVSRLKAWWYDPRDGQAHAAGEHANGEAAFTSPIGGPDWVLVLDDVTKAFPAPGKREHE